ncbi:MAG: hypothetical protein DME19_15065 [Verrucomicrobia bacterium]|nr:MAG: hypothetical protein DME19_15065 [Verrucomicrobiota bacterium]
MEEKDRMRGSGSWKASFRFCARIGTMNQIGTPLPALSPQGGERVAEGRERGGSWKASTVLPPRIWTMNGGARFRRALINGQKSGLDGSLAPPGSWSGKV